MAHAQPTHERAEVYYEKHKNDIKEIVKIVASDAVANHCDRTGKRDKVKDAAITGGRIDNNAKGDCIKLHDKHHWSGESVVAYPERIAKGYAGEFVHFECTACDEGAVVYADGGGFGWLLAWSVGGLTAFGANRNKVYIEVKPIREYANIKWDAVKANLDGSRDISSCTEDGPVCMAFASVSPGKKAAVIATFNALTLL